MDNTTNLLLLHCISYCTFHPIMSLIKIKDYEVKMLGNSTFNHDAACLNYFFLAYLFIQKVHALYIKNLYFVNR